MMRRYPTYRDSGVDWLGEVPQHWEVGPLKRRWMVSLGKMLQPEPKSEEDTFAQYLRAANIKWGRVDISDINSMWFSPSDRSALTLKDGDLLVSEGGDVGRSAIWRGELDECYFQNSVNRVRPRPNASTAYLYYWMATIKAKGYVDVICNKSTIAHFTAEKVAAVPVPMPPLPEQTAIAAFLDRETAKIDALVAEQRRLIDLLREKRQAVISHAVTKGLNPNAPMKPSGVDWLGDVPEGWEVVPLKRLTSEITVGIVVEPSKYYADEGVPALRSMNVRPGKLVADNLVFISQEANELLDKSQVHAGDLVAVRTGQPGTCAVIGEDFAGCNCIDLIIVRKPSTMESHFLRWYLTSDVAVRQFDEGSGGAIQQHFNVGMAKELLIMVPPVSEQRRIVAHLEEQTAKLDTLTAAAETAVSLLLERRAALISAAVTGKINVRSEAPEATEAA